MAKPHQIIFLNGPPRSGKDTAARFAEVEFINIRTSKFAGVIKRTMKAYLGLSDAMYKDLESEGSTLKDNPLFYGMSWRQLLIWFSEECAKPQFGDGIFGYILANELKLPTSTYVTIITDCGFKDEVRAVVNVAGAANCHMFQLFRQGHTFAGDSRSYLAQEDFPKIGSWHVINNDFELDMFKRQILMRVNRILGFDRSFD